MANREVNTIMQTITDEFQEIMNGDVDTFKGYSVIVTNEQQYIKNKSVSPNTFYVVIKFLQGNSDFGQLRQPITINALSEHNTIYVCQKLMMDFAETYNLKVETKSENNYTYTMRQTMTTVSSAGNFTEVFTGFRSVFYASGTFYIAWNSAPIEKLEIATSEDGEKTEIEFITAHYTYDAQYDSRPFFTTNNFNKTVNKTATFALSFSMYSTYKTPEPPDVKGFEIYKAILDTIFNDGNPNINTLYYVTLTFANISKSYTIPMRLVSVSGTQELRDFPAVSITMMR